MTALGIELSKLKRKRLWLTVLLVLGLEVLWIVAMTTISLGREIQAPREMGYIIGQTSQVHAIFAPILVTVVASRLAAIEHDGEMMPVLFAANQSRGSLFRTKYLVTLAVAVFASIVIVALVGAIGSLHGFPSDPSLLGTWLCGLVLASIPVTGIQLALALLFARQAVTLTVGIIGGLVGSFATFVPPSVGVFIPWQYPGLVTPVRLDVTSDGYVAGFPLVDHLNLLITIVAIVGIATVAVSQLVFVRRVSK